ncbi:MAG: NAD(P)H-dependent flavin oxidoreductase [Galactobacter sp.]
MSHDVSLLLDLQLPVINAPMAGAAGGALASAVGGSGGLGLVGVGHGASAEFVDRELSLAADLSSAAWGAGLMSWSLERDASALTRVLEYQPPVVAFAAGDPTAHAKVAHAAGALVVVQVGASGELLAADADPHIAAIVVRGSEAGGHGLNQVSTFTLLQFALQHTSKPVIVAGGVGSAQGVAGALGAGASAVWVGTRLIPTAESLAPEAHKRRVLGAAPEDTVYTSVFDIALDIPWPHEYGGRTLVNDVTAEHAGPTKEAALRVAKAQGASAAQALSSRVQDAKAKGDASASPLYAGQAAGLVKAVPSMPDAVFPPAADVLAELGGFRDHLAKAAQRWSK